MWLGRVGNTRDVICNRVLRLDNIVERSYIVLLILNCLVDDRNASDFNKAISRLLENINCEYEIRRACQTESIIDLLRYTHLIISGSEASALDDNPWDGLLINIIRSFITEKKQILGICYGHQFLARTLIGKGCLKKRTKPEIGWVKINTASNKLFENVNEAVSFVLHYDEVAYLTNDFRIIASSKSCPIHAFQYKDFPVWGIQFHPEYNLEQSKKIFESISKIEPNFDNYFSNDLQETTQLINIELVINNILKAC
jgi:GMP synthase-like glutamine amidotransferase